MLKIFFTEFKKRKKKCTKKIFHLVSHMKKILLKTFFTSFHSNKILLKTFLLQFNKRGKKSTKLFFTRIHTWKKCVKPSKRNVEKCHLKITSKINKLYSILTFDLMSNQFLHRVVHHCLCIFFWMSYQMYTCDRVTFHCSNVENVRIL